MQGKRTFTGLLLALFMLLSTNINAGEPTPDSLQGVTVVTAATVKQWLDNGDDIMILDARKQSDYEEGHLPDAEQCSVPTDLNISPDAITRSADALAALETIADLDKNIKIVAYCNSFK